MPGMKVLTRMERSTAKVNSTGPTAPLTPVTSSTTTSTDMVFTHGPTVESIPASGR